MTPEPTDELVERVREALAMHPGWQQADVALTELAERLKAAERERDECAVLLADTTLSTHDLAAQRDELVERLKAAERALAGTQKTLYAEVGRTNAAEARAEAAERERDEWMMTAQEWSDGCKRAEEQHDELVEALERIVKAPSRTDNEDEKLIARRALAKHRDPYGPIGHETC